MQNTPTPSPPTLDTYADQIARLLAEHRFAVAERWLLRLNEILNVAPNEVFPSDRLLDHIPALIGDIATYLRAPEEEEIAANSAVLDKARELGAASLRTTGVGAPTPPRVRHPR